jgi:hypothetical protein
VLCVASLYLQEAGYEERWGDDSVWASRRGWMRMQKEKDKSGPPDRAES